MKKTLLFILSVLFTLSIFAQVPSYIDTNGLLGWYPFNGNANNAYGTGRNGSVRGAGTVLTSDRFSAPNSAYHLSGNHDHIVIDTAFFNVGWSEFTISWWMKNDTLINPYSTYNDQCAFSTIPQEGMLFDVHWGSANKYSLWANHDPSAYAVWDILPGSQANSIPTPHVWNHFAIVKEHDSFYHFYLNGILDTTFKSTVMAMGYYCKFNFGNIDSAQPNEGVMGSIDDYGIWHRALGGCEVRKLFGSTAHLFVTAHPADDTFVLSGTASFSITDIGTGNTYQWQMSTGGAYANVPSTSPYSGVTTPTLTITGVTSGMTGNRFRCVVTGSGGCVDTSNNAGLIMSALGVVNGAIAPISVTPNPTTGDIMINNSAPVNVKIYNTPGQLVAQASLTNKISIADKPAGLYFVKLYDAKGTLVYYDRIIKK